MLLFMLFLLAGTLALSASTLDCTHPLVRLNEKAEVVGGSAQAVIDAVRAGSKIRIGYASPQKSRAPDVEHWVDGTFFTVQGANIYASFWRFNIEELLGSLPRAQLNHAGVLMGLLSTNGTFQRQSDNEFNGKTEIVPMVWCESPESHADRCAYSWKMLYRNDAQGRRVAGAKADLLAAVQQGAPLRLVWGGKDGDNTWSHSAAPTFVTAMNDKAVVAQLPPHTLQDSYRIPEKARLNMNNQTWRGLLSTDGTFDVQVYFGQGQTPKRWPQRAAVSWMAWTQPPSCSESAAAYTEAGQEDAPLK